MREKRAVKLNRRFFLSVGKFLARSGLEVSGEGVVTGCDGKLTKTHAYLQKFHRRPGEALAWLRERGLTCDCKVAVIATALFLGDLKISPTRVKRFHIEGCLRHDWEPKPKQAGENSSGDAPEITINTYH